ncbi:MAG: hemin-degrading factor [Bacteroidetes bacterium]|jgi:putative hemin transport protein|nr:hemin-degrading factor [Bacteroidota bacterium]
MEELNTTLSLSEKWDQLKKENPKMRAKQAADELGVSEAELIASKCDGKTIIRLDGPWEEVIERIERLGYVMALTRNESAVHEKKGIYQNFKFSSHVGLVLDENIDLRIFMKHWHFGFAVPVENPRGTLRSLQFFDQDGEAIHKVYLMNKDHHEEYEKLVSDFTHSDQGTGISVLPVDDSETEKPDEEIDVEGFLREWSELKDTHDFFPLTRKYDVTRTQALRLADGRFARKVDNRSTRSMLEMASEREVPIMVFVRSRGVIQIHSGPVKKIKVMGDWLNVLDPEFNLHLRENHIAHSWVVEKPTEDGIVTSLEIFDENKNNIATFFGARKPGKPELEGWREIAKNLH